MARSPRAPQELPTSNKKGINGKLALQEPKIGNGSMPHVTEVSLAKYIRCRRCNF